MSRRKWLFLLASILLVALGVAVAGAVCGPLYWLLMPPRPPRYPGAQLVTSQSEAPGVDVWRYRTEDDVCRVYDYYHARADACQLGSPAFCPGPRKPPYDGSDRRTVVACRWASDAGLFVWEWEARMDEVFADEGIYTVFDLRRTVYWMMSHDE